MNGHAVISARKNGRECYIERTAAWRGAGAGGGGGAEGVSQKKRARRFTAVLRCIYTAVYNNENGRELVFPPVSGFFFTNFFFIRRFERNRKFSLIRAYFRSIIRFCPPVIVRNPSADAPDSGSSRASCALHPRFVTMTHFFFSRLFVPDFRANKRFLAKCL